MAEETEEEKRHRLIKSYRADLPHYNGQISTSEGKLKKYAEDYEKYVNALEQIGTAATGVGEGQGEIQKGKESLSSCAGGNKYGEASGAISMVASMFGMVVSSGIGSIIKYIQTDMLLLNEKYVGEYPKYTKAIEGYNKVAAKIRHLGASCPDKEQTITKSSLL